MAVIKQVQGKNLRPTNGWWLDNPKGVTGGAEKGNNPHQWITFKQHKKPKNVLACKVIHQFSALGKSRCGF
jgi:hypothetical protein